jgi:hypothetical protein
MRLGPLSLRRWDRYVGFWLFCFLLRCQSKMVDGIRRFSQGSWSDKLKVSKGWQQVLNTHSFPVAVLCSCKQENVAISIYHFLPRSVQPSDYKTILSGPRRIRIMGTKLTFPTSPNTSTGRPDIASLGIKVDIWRWRGSFRGESGKRLGQCNDRR